MKRSPYSVTMSALAASTATVSGVFSSMSAAFWLAPRFRNKQTCLEHSRWFVDSANSKRQKKPKKKTVHICWASVQTQCGPAWWHGGGVLGPERPVGSHWLRFAAETRRWPVNPGVQHQFSTIIFPHKNYTKWLKIFNFNFCQLCPNYSQFRWRCTFLTILFNTGKSIGCICIYFIVFSMVIITLAIIYYNIHIETYMKISTPLKRKV